MTQNRNRDPDIVRGPDAIATAAEETKNPSRDLAIGIVGSMIVFG